ncbi:O-antigen ligase [Devosia sp.]|uniref:O-antigen ligase family protein n=1 Tax=Devosia sp. TaxID=1871048 RepID=UPI0025CFBAB6|nr:O-antigen ligase family protein [Devosia sp.]MCR6636415.1 O-antigen ligase family protein [Devosia sp.]
MQGLSNNPNQIAFLAVVGLAFLAVLDLLRTLPAPVLSLASGACGLAGAMSGSSAFTPAVATALVLISVVACTNYLRGKRVRIRLVLVLPASFLLLAHVPLPINVDFPIPVGASSSGDFLDMEADNGQGSVRFLLWSNAISAVTESPLVGLGPGAHVPLVNPATGSVTLNEAHNTAIDLLVVTGVLGLVAFLVLAGFVIWNAHKEGVLVYLLVCLMPVASYALFHYLGRQPLFWIAMYLSAGSIPLLLRHSGLVSGAPKPSTQLVQNVAPGGLDSVQTTCLLLPVCDLIWCCA